MVSLLFQNNLIVTIEDGAFTDSLTYLDLDNNQLHFSHPNTFANLSSLATLYLSNNRISVISPTTFSACHSLSILTLDSNLIGWLNSSHFSDCSSLSTLTVSYNNIALLGNGTFTHLVSMFNLDLSYNKLTEISGFHEDFHNMSFTYLNFAGNQITSVMTDTYINLQATYLYLQDNSIAYIDTYAFLDCSITYLHLTGNPLKYIRAYSFVDSTIYDLYMQSNEIRHIPSYAFYDVGGNTLDLSSNQISYIEEAAFKVSYTNLKLESNGLSDILGAMFNSSSSVTTLSLHSNLLTSLLPLTFYGLSATAVTLNDNQITVYPGDALSLLALKTIDLSDNQIAEIQDGSLDSESGLEVLTLDNNYITHIQDGLFDNMVSIQSVSIQNNLLVYIADELFTSDSLSSIDLSQNSLYHLPRLMADGTSQVSSVSVTLTDNPIQSISHHAFGGIDSGTITLSSSSLQCGCSAYHTLVEKDVKVDGEATCSYPPSTNSESFLSPYSGSNVDFGCAPINLKVSQPAINVIDLAWSLNGTNNTSPYENRYEYNKI